MPYGIHIATCLHCHKQWVVGDCIPDICNECIAKGHKGFPIKLEGFDYCLACDKEREERMDEARKASDEAKRLQAQREAAESEVHRQRPWPGRKATGFRRGW